MLVYPLAVICIIIIVYIVYSKIKHSYCYWEKKGVKGPTPTPLVGNFGSILSKSDSVGTYLCRVYDEYPEEKYIGIYQGTTPALVLRDPEAIQRVLKKDFSSFIDRGFSTTKDPITQNLFTEDGDHWKILRQKFSPIFTSGKLKQMMPIINKCIKDYLQYVDKVIDQQHTQEIRKINMKYTLKVITSVAFGLDIDAFTDEESKFVQMAEKIFKPSLKRIISLIVNDLVPGLLETLNITFTGPEVKYFFGSLVRQIIKQRQGEAILRNDFMDLMIEMKDQKIIRNNREDGVVEMEVTEEIITAQALLFYAAGFETSSGAMSYLLYELALNPEVQDKCYDEIQVTMSRHNGDISYEGLKELKYLNMTLEETLRKHSIVASLQRKAVTSYKVDSNLTIDKGTIVMIPVHSLQSDPTYFSNPEVFDPDRFTPENKCNIRDGTYLPFGDGPRNCIGMRFAKVQSLLGVASFLNKYRVTPCERTVAKVRFDPRCVTQVCKDGLWMNIERR